MHNNQIGDIICQYRQMKKMTQSEFASRLGVTSQAVSKWECGNGIPDVSLIGSICTILGIGANTLLGLEESVVENNNIYAQTEIKSNMFAEPLVLLFSSDLIPVVCAGIETDYINEKRIELIKRTGMLLPILRLRDDVSLDSNTYRIISYDHFLLESHAETTNDNIFKSMIDDVISCCEKNYATILNKHLVKLMLDNLNELYPGIMEDLIPNKITYLQVERKLQEKLAQGESIKDMIHILEELEEA